MSTPRASGAYIALTTPRWNGDFDEQSYGRLVRRVSAAGADLLVLGTTGEFMHLSAPQKKRVIDVAVGNCGRRNCVVGVGAKSLDETLEVSAHARDKGAYALMFTPEYYGNGAGERLLNDVLRIGLPVVLYNNPRITDGRSLPLIHALEASNLPGVVGIKDSSGDSAYFSKLLEMQSDSFGALQGSDEHILSSLNAGASGLTTGIGQVNPELVVRLYANRDPADSAALMRLRAGLKSLNNDTIKSIKAVLAGQGTFRSSEMFS